MNKLTEIISSWAKAYQRNEDDVVKAEQRYLTCSTCEFRKTHDVTGHEFCSACGCPLKGKIFTPLSPEEGNCPKNKWKI